MSSPFQTLLQNPAIWRGSVQARVHLPSIPTGFAELDRESMEIDGRIIALGPGMSVTAEIKTGQRRVIEYLLSPVLKYTHESIRER